MPDEQLTDYVLQRAADDDLGEPARLLVVAALGDPDEVVGPDRLTVAISRLDAQVATLVWHRAAALVTPDAAEIEQACAAMRFATSARAEAERAADALSADRVQFLETSLEFHDRHGTQPCPVCAQGTLDQDWVARARAALAAEHDAAGALRAARSGAHRARQTLAALVRAIDAPPAEDAQLTTIAAARVAYESFSALPVDDDAALADHVALALPGLRTAYDALRKEAAGLIVRDDAGADAAAAPKLEIAREAQKWLHALASTLQR